MEPEEFAKQHELTRAVRRGRHDDRVRPHRADIHEEAPAVAAGMKRWGDDATFGIGFILSSAVDRECKNALHREEVIVLPNLSDDFLLSARVAFILAELPIGAGVDVAVSPTE